MTSSPLALSGEKGPLDPRVLGPRIAGFARAFPNLVTILDVAPRLYEVVKGPYRLRWVGDWGGDQTSAFSEMTKGRGPWLRIVQEEIGVRAGDILVRHAAEIEAAQELARRVFAPSLQ